MTQYLIQKHYGIEPGFVFRQGSKQFLVVDVITHRWNADAKLHEALPDPLVVYRPLIFSHDIHERNILELSQFKELHSNT